MEPIEKRARELFEIFYKHPNCLLTENEKEETFHVDHELWEALAKKTFEYELAVLIDAQELMKTAYKNYLPRQCECGKEAEVYYGDGRKLCSRCNANSKIR
jgi:hypothetical protein